MSIEFSYNFSAKPKTGLEGIIEVSSIFVVLFSSSHSGVWGW
jgi:hypothetical protein